MKKDNDYIYNPKNYGWSEKKDVMKGLYEIGLKCVYDDVHEYYKVCLNIDINDMLLEHLSLVDLWVEYDVYFDDISFDDLLKYTGVYYIGGLKCVEDELDKEELKSLLNFMSLPYHVRQCYYGIYLELTRYTLTELKNSNFPNWRI